MTDNDTLILYYFQDGLSVDEREQVRVRLASDTTLAQRYQSLCQDMDRFHHVASEPAPAAATARWRQALDQVIVSGPKTSRWPQFNLSKLIWIGAGAAILMVGIGIGVQLGHDTVPGNVGPSIVDHGAGSDEVIATQRETLPSALTRGVATYLNDTQTRLISISQADETQRTELIRQIVSQNSLYIRQAEANGANDIARILRALSPVMLSMAGNGAPSHSIDAQISQLDFELNVTLTKLKQRASNTAYEL